MFSDHNALGVQGLSFWLKRISSGTQREKSVGHRASVGNVAARAAGLQGTLSERVAGRSWATRWRSIVAPTRFSGVSIFDNPGLSWPSIISNGRRLDHGTSCCQFEVPIQDSKADREHEARRLCRQFLKLLSSLRPRPLVLAELGLLA